MHKREVSAMPIVDVVYEDVEGWHRFTSPHIPGLYVIVEPDQYWMGYEDVPRVIEMLASGDDKKVAVRAVDRPPGNAKPKILHYSVESLAS
jgi:hypothetical protein